MRFGHFVYLCIWLWMYSGHVLSLWTVSSDLSWCYRCRLFNVHGNWIFTYSGNKS